MWIPFNVTDFFDGRLTAHVLWLWSLACSVVWEIRKWCSSNVVDGKQIQTSLSRNSLKKSLFWMTLFFFLLFLPCQMVLPTRPKLFPFTLDVNWVTTGVRRVSDATCWSSIQLMQRAFLPLTNGRPRQIVYNRDIKEKYPLCVCD